MKRVKRHKIKHEKPETSSAYNAVKEEHDLAYYIHDRVELMHQVFSVLKAKDLKAIAPECVRTLSIDDLEELCTEELLGISSKRLLAILDGAEPPSDTESSSQSSAEPMETISLDSISSDEELLSHGSKKKHKHKRHSSKSKKHKKKPAEEDSEATEANDRSKASRAGLTVLELLELQARARAIRAQLQQEQIHKQQNPQADSSKHFSSDSEVEIKEEAAEVVEISSDDEKPTAKELEKALASTTKEKNKNGQKNDSNTTNNISNKASTVAETNNTDKETAKNKKKKDKSKKKDKRKDSEKEIEVTIENKKDTTTEKEATEQNTSTDKQTVTKRVNDLIITVPQATSRKIKLNRSKVSVAVNNDFDKVHTNVAADQRKVVVTSAISKEGDNNADSVKKVSSVVREASTVDKTMKSVVKVSETRKGVTENNKDKTKTKNKAKKNKKKEKRDSIDEDHDEITLQLSDSEKMDLLEDIDIKDFDKVSSSSEDSESSSESSDSDSSVDKTIKTTSEETVQENGDDKINSDKGNDEKKLNSEINKVEIEDNNFFIEDSNKNDGEEQSRENDTNDLSGISIGSNTEANDKVDPTSPQIQSPNSNQPTGFISIDKEQTDEPVIEISDVNDIPIREDEAIDETAKSYIITDNDNTAEDDDVQNLSNLDKQDKIEKIDKEEIVENVEINKIKEKNHKKSTKDKITKDKDKDLSEGELSSKESSEVEAFDLKPEVISISDEETPKKKKKKEKKAKKQKKKSDFRESGDQNFYKDDKDDDDDKNVIVILEDDHIEVFELSDDSSCYEVEGTVLSKEPTAEEIAALSAKIDEIERKENLAKLKEDTQENQEENEIDLERISWKDRYLGSTKVKKVLSTSNIFNVLRKKNKELKKKIAESKKAEQQSLKDKELEPIVENPKENLEEGSIEHYNTLQGSTRYVNPVPDPEELKEQLEQIRKTEVELKQKEIEMKITGEMKKDAKQLLKMYKKLLKYNDVSKQKDPNKKRNKKKKKKEKELAST